MQSLDLPAPAATALLGATQPQGEAEGAWGLGGPSLGSLFPLLLPLAIAQTSPPPS